MRIVKIYLFVFFFFQILTGTDKNWEGGGGVLFLFRIFEAVGNFCGSVPLRIVWEESKKKSEEFFLDVFLKQLN